MQKEDPDETTPDQRLDARLQAATDGVANGEGNGGETTTKSPKTLEMSTMR